MLQEQWKGNIQDTMSEYYKELSHLFCLADTTF